MNGAFYGIKEAQIFVVNLPTVQGLGQFGGFDMWLQDRSGAGYEQLTQARNILLGQAAQKPDHLVGVRPNAWKTRRSCSCTWTACRRSRWACRCRTCTAPSS